MILFMKKRERTTENIILFNIAFACLILQQINSVMLIFTYTMPRQFQKVSNFYDYGLSSQTSVLTYLGLFLSKWCHFLVKHFISYNFDSYFSLKTCSILILLFVSHPHAFSLLLYYAIYIGFLRVLNIFLNSLAKC